MSFQQLILNILKYNFHLISGHFFQHTIMFKLKIIFFIALKCVHDINACQSSIIRHKNVKEDGICIMKNKGLNITKHRKQHTKKKSKNKNKRKSSNFSRKITLHDIE